MTARQIEVLALVARGNTYQEAADVLGVSPATVKRHLRESYERLDVLTGTPHNTRLEAFRKLGWLRVP